MSGRPELDHWLKARALRAERTQTARTYVLALEDGAEVIAYYCLSSYAIDRGTVGGGWLGRNAPDPIPVVLLGRLAVDLRHQGKGLGKALLKDATLKAEGAAHLIGARALLVHALDDAASRFYRRYGFAPLPARSDHLYAALGR